MVKEDCCRSEVDINVKVGQEPSGKAMWLFFLEGRFAVKQKAPKV